MELTYLGHSTFLLNAGTSRLLFDPYISKNSLAKNINIDEIVTDFILISHGHIDHIDDLSRIYKNQKKCVVISTIEIINWLIKKKKISKYHPMTPGGKWNFDFGLIQCVAENHSNSLPDGTYGGIALGFIIKMENKTIYFAGDTGLHQQMKQIKLFYKIDYALLPIGGNFTMDIDEAIVAADFVGTKNIIGMHYNTNAMISINKNLCLKKAKKNNKKLILMNIGEKLDL